MRKPAPGCDCRSAFGHVVFHMLASRTDGSGARLGTGRPGPGFPPIFVGRAAPTMGVITTQHGLGEDYRPPRAVRGGCLHAQIAADAAGNYIGGMNEITRL